MEIYFMRHGLAEERETWNGADFDRPLTDKGKERLAESAEKIAQLNLDLQAVITSPLKRAYETAKIVVDHLGIASSLFQDERLAPGFDVERLEAILTDHPEAQRLMIVGHEPDFSETIGALIGGRVVCKKGSLARVDLPLARYAGEEGETPVSLPQRGELVWLIPPKVLVL
jgi:phosphohistidine phosphatase